MNPFKGRHFQRDIILWAAYTVDALAVRGDEGRANLRKASVR